MMIHLVVSVTHRTHGDELVTVVHHRDQKIEQDDDVDQREASKHDQAPEPEGFDVDCWSLTLNNSDKHETL